MATDIPSLGFCTGTLRTMRRSIAGMGLLFSVLAAGCGSDGTTAPESTTTSAPGPSNSTPATTQETASTSTSAQSAQHACDAFAQVLVASSKFTESEDYEEQRAGSIELAEEIVAALDSIQSPPAEIETALDAHVRGWRITIRAFEQSADASSYLTNLQRLGREEFASDAEVEANDAVVNEWAETNCSIQLDFASYFAIDA